jgi:CSLREA domain-containing protein
MRTRFLIAVPLAMVASLLLSSTALAGVRLTVNTTADDTSFTNNDSVCSLREAVETSNGTPGITDCPSSGTPPENQIVFDPALGTSPVIDLTAFGSLQFGTNDVTITGPATVNGPPNDRVIFSNNITLTLDSLTISNGHENTGTDGGGIKVNLGRLFLNGSSVTGNTETFSGTASGDAQGGGIFSSNAPVTLTDSTVSNNTAVANLTGATAAASANALGGGIEVSGDDLTLENSTVSGNHANASSDALSGGLEGDGGGIRTDGSVLIEHSTISGNTGSANATGGAQPVSQGGGVLVHGSASDGIDVELSTVANNRVEAVGTNTPLVRAGGVGDNLSSTDDNFVSDTIAGNGLDPASSTANVQGLNFWSGGVGTGSRTFDNTIIANPVGSAGTNCSGDVPLSDDAGAPNVDFPSDDASPCFMPATNILTLDPQLGALGISGGTTATMLPAPTSPVIDKGSAADQNDLNEDQRGLTRPVLFSGLSHPFDGSDIGSVEVQQACSGQATPTSTCTGPPSPPPTQPTTPTKKKKCKKHKKGKKASAAKKKKCKKKKK